MEFSPRRAIKLTVKLDGREAASKTMCVSNGAHVLTLVTVLPEMGLAIEHSSAFVGHRGVAMTVTHLTLGPPGEDPKVRKDEHEHNRVDPSTEARGCVYEHVQVLLEHLGGLGYDARIDIPDNAFKELERVVR